MNSLPSLLNRYIDSFVGHDGDRQLVSRQCAHVRSHNLDPIAQTATRRLQQAAIVYYLFT